MRRKEERSAIATAAPEEAVAAAPSGTQVASLLIGVEISFTKWVKSEKTADGWALVWKGTGMDMEGKEYEITAYSVRKTVGAASYDCYGSVKNGGFLEKNFELCQSLKPFAE